MCSEGFTLVPDEKGNEHIIQFAFEGWWISDLSSFNGEAFDLHD
jgi:hypothetical protein